MDAVIETLSLQQSHTMLFYGKEANVHNLILNFDFQAICTLSFQKHILPNFNINKFSNIYQYFFRSISIFRLDFTISSIVHTLIYI